MDSPTLNTPRGRDEESEDDVVADVVVEDDHDDDLILPLDLSALREDEGSVDETCQPEELAHPGVVVSSGQVPKPGEVDLLLHIPAFEGVSSLGSELRLFCNLAGEICLGSYSTGSSRYGLDGGKPN